MKRHKQKSLQIIHAVLLFAALLALFAVTGNFPPEVVEVAPESALPEAPVPESARRQVVRLYTPDYVRLRDGLIREFSGAMPGRFGEFVKGVYEYLDTPEKIMALTFDACGGKSRGYNAGLIGFLRKSKVPATLFVTGLWIDENPAIFRDLARDPLFEIENHGLLHRLCGVAGETKFGIAGTANVGEVVDEMELNTRKIARLTGRRPVYFRSATAYTDETAAKIARKLGLEIVSYSVLSGDAAPRVPARVLRDNIVNNARPGAIVIMHFNHPERKEEEALRAAIPLLQARGFSFVKLGDFKLKGR